LIFHETKLSDCYIIEPELHEDERGYLARTFDADEFRARRLNPCVAQCSVSFNRVAGTLRGLHFQAAPFEEAKVVRCVHGRVFDVAVDLRTESENYLQWCSFDLSDENHLAVYIPEGMAHGFLTLSDDVELHYQISSPYVPDAARGARWDDPALGIPWPRKPAVISARDQGWSPIVVS
jgi:dTDP-4-dehydrorhamnose 3,5-epimerase